MRVLIGCEHSGVVRDAFRARGHDAWSADLLETTAPGPHIRGDLLEVIEREAGNFDLFIAHPPCTFLTVSAAWCFYHPDDKALPVEKRRPHPKWPNRRQDQAKAIEFFRACLDAPFPKVAVENPAAGAISKAIRRPDQVVQPYYFGHDASKGTGLWLRGLLPLQAPAGGYVKPRLVCKACGGTSGYDRAFGAGCEHCGAEAGKLLPRWANQTDGGFNRLPPSEDRWALRSLTYQGIADAMAEQWGG
jgi:hypothetical protein